VLASVLAYLIASLLISIHQPIQIGHALLLISQELILDQNGATNVLEFTVSAILECLHTTIGDNSE
jgi:hypothetical protein